MSQRVVTAGLISAFLVFSGTSHAEDALAPEQREYVEDVFLSLFYHEIGHALIDVKNLPVLGLEEDAADILSVLLINRFWEEDYADRKARAAADYWSENAEFRSRVGDDVSYSGTHSPDQRRYFTYVCLFYGADTEGRSAFAADMALPDDRAESCAEEFALAESGWGGFLEGIEAAGPGTAFTFEGDRDSSPFALLLSDEIDWMNERMSLLVPISVRIERCGEANSFYFPDQTAIVMCSEFIDELERLAAAGHL